MFARGGKVWAKVFGSKFARSGDVGKQSCCGVEWDKNASQTGRNDVIGGFDGKEVRIGMQPCKRADASCRRRAIGPHAWADHLFFFFSSSFFFPFLFFPSFVLTGVDESKATTNESLGGVELFDPRRRDGKEGKSGSNSVG